MKGIVKVLVIVMVFGFFINTLQAGGVNTDKMGYDLGRSIGQTAHNIYESIDWQGCRQAIHDINEDINWRGLGENLKDLGYSLGIPSAFDSAKEFVVDMVTNNR